MQGRPAALGRAGRGALRATRPAKSTTVEPCMPACSVACCCECRTRRGRPRWWHATTASTSTTSASRWAGVEGGRAGERIGGRQGRSRRNGGWETWRQAEAGQSTGAAARSSGRRGLRLQQWQQGRRRQLAAGALTCAEEVEGAIQLLHERHKEHRISHSQRAVGDALWVAGRGQTAVAGRCSVPPQQGPWQTGRQPCTAPSPRELKPTGEHTPLCRPAGPPPCRHR